MAAFYLQIAITFLSVLTVKAQSLKADGVYYNFKLERRQLHPELVNADPQITMNGISPGPPIRVKKGQTVVLDLHSKIVNNSETMHIHGFLQSESPYYDGPLGLSQCPIPTDTTFQYKTVAEKSGSYWYHGHSDGFYVDGQIGMVVVDPVVDPYANDYDQEEYLQISDFYMVSSLKLMPGYLFNTNQDHVGEEPVPDKIAVNNAFSDSYTISASKNKNLKIRLGNAAALSMYKFYVDGMNLTVIEVDATTTKAYDVPYLLLSVAQRVSFILKWNNLADKLKDEKAIRFHVDADPMMYPAYFPDELGISCNGLYGAGGCFLANAYPNNCKAAYESQDPNVNCFDTKWTGTIQFEDDAEVTYANDLPVPNEADFQDSNLLNAQLFYQDTSTFAPAPTVNITLNMYFQNLVECVKDICGVYQRAFVNDATFFPGTKGYNYPLIENYLDKRYYESYYNGVDNINYFGSGKVPFVFPYGAIVDVVVNNFDGGSHPFHSHGYDFWIIECKDSSGVSVPNPYIPNSPYYLIRDTVTIPTMGMCRLRFNMINPGIWMFHCHIDWHVANGLSTLFIVQKSDEYDVSWPDSQQRNCEKYFASTTTKSPISKVSTYRHVFNLPMVLSLSILIASLIGGYLIYYIYRKRTASYALLKMAMNPAVEDVVISPPPSPSGITSKTPLFSALES